MESLKKIAYLGVGDKIPGTRFGPKLRKGCSYYCVDLPDNKYFKEGLKKYESLDESIKYRINIELNDVQNLDWNPESMDEIHIHNVFGDPSIIHFDSFIEKSAYSIKRNGFIFVAESYTPYPLSELISNFATRDMKFKLIAPKINFIFDNKNLQKFSNLVEYMKKTNENLDWKIITEHMELSKCLNELKVREDYPGDRIYKTKKFSWGSMSGYFPDVNIYGPSSEKLFEFIFGGRNNTGYIIRFSKI
jgi:hypothetical protein